MGGQSRGIRGFDRPTLAAREWVLSIEELRERDWASRQIERAVDLGLLHRWHHGVYVVGRPELSFLGQCRAAWLACGGEGAAVSHISGAGVHKFAKPFGKIHVSGPRSLKGHPALIVHRPRSLSPDDVVERHGFAVTSVARTLLDMSPRQPVDQIGRWMHEAKVQGVLDRRAVWDILQRHPHHRGARRLEAALAFEVSPGSTGLEAAYWAVVQSAMPRPDEDRWVWSGAKTEEVDFVWRELNLIVETDGGRYHGSRWRQRRDQAKDERYRALGWIVRRFHELEIVMEPAAVRAETLDLANRGRSNPRMR